MIANEAESYRDIGRLLIACPDRPGIVAAVSHFLAAQGANIVHSDQHSTNPVGGAFFMRLEFQLPELTARSAELESDFAELAGPFSMDWRLAYAERPKTLAIFTSRADHALVELLWRHRAGDLRAEILMVISNHPNVEETAASWKIPFYLVPVERDRKGEAEQRQLELVLGKVDTLVLARYMQVLSSEFIAHFPNRIINIHHSFLPAFAGADPYARASERGVKLIGATAHYVTEELDAGPIIEQDVQRVDHRHSTGELRRLGRYVSGSCWLAPSPGTPKTGCSSTATARWFSPEPQARGWERVPNKFAAGLIHGNRSWRVQARRAPKDATSPQDSKRDSSGLGYSSGPTPTVVFA